MGAAQMKQDALQLLMYTGVVMLQRYRLSDDPVRLESSWLRDTQHRISCWSIWPAHTGRSCALFLAEPKKKVSRACSSGNKCRDNQYSNKHHEASQTTTPCFLNHDISSTMWKRL
jgi:hypothetical protein